MTDFRGPGPPERPGHDPDDHSPALSKHAHQVLAFFALVGAVIALFAAYDNHRADAKTCAFINNMNRQLGGGQTCVSGPTVSLLVTAAVLAGLGLVLYFTWALRRY